MRLLHWSLRWELKMWRLVPHGAFKVVIDNQKLMIITAQVEVFSPLPSRNCFFHEWKHGRCFCPDPSINTNTSDWGGGLCSSAAASWFLKFFFLSPIYLSSLTPFLCFCCQAFQMSRSPLGCLSATALTDGLMARWQETNCKASPCRAIRRAAREAIKHL